MVHAYMLTVVDSIYNIIYYVPFVSLCTIALIIEMGNTEVFVLQLFQSNVTIKFSLLLFYGYIYIRAVYKCINLSIFVPKHYKTCHDKN